MIIACLLLSAQGIGQLSISRKEAPLRQLLTDIEKQTDYNFYINPALLRKTNKVTIDVTNASLQQVLDHCFKNQPLQYIIVDKTITILPKPAEKDTSRTISVPALFGLVLNEEDEPVPGATITIKKTNKGFATTDKGEFSLQGIRLGDTVQITNIGYAEQLLVVKDLNRVTIRLQSKSNSLVDVEVVHNGYQSNRRSNTTGSATVIDNKLLNRKVSTNIIDRLEGVTSGLILNKNIVQGVNQSEISIRGRATIFANPSPLIVVDNFPYNGEISNINPNDVESITILKDAAAAAIWGAFAGNGVIVITMKKGKYNQEPKVSLITNVTIGDKPDIFDAPFLHSSDQIDIEQFLYERNFYRSSENSPLRPVLSPVVELLNKKRRGLIAPQEADAQLNALRYNDVRRDIDRYFYQRSIEQQYGLNISGGSAQNQYYFSAGYDRNRNNEVGDKVTRVTINGNNTFTTKNKKLELVTGLIIAHSSVNESGKVFQGLNYPYLRLADAEGNALSIPFTRRQSYKDTAGGGLLLDWDYRPLDEIMLADDKTQLMEYRINTGISYKVMEGLEVKLLYQYGYQDWDQKRFQSQESYYTRNMINEYTQISPSGLITRPVPLGGIMNFRRETTRSQNLRVQGSYNRTWGDKHVFSALAGAEIRNAKGDFKNNILYGYDKDTRTSSPVDYQTDFPMYYFPFETRKIPYREESLGTTANFISWFSNVQYTLNGRYIFSASARKEESNIFGVKTNQKGVPLWSLGAAWIVSNEKFYKSTWLPYLKIRATNGYSGNVDKSVSAFTTAVIGRRNEYGAIPAYVDNPPNPSLRWEKSHMINVGLDFATRNDRIAGSIEYYSRKAKDLIGFSAIDPTTGIAIFKGNNGNMGGKGIDIVIHTKNINKKIRWQSTVLFSYASDKVTGYESQQNSISFYYNSGLLNPLPGKPLYSVYSLRWVGLDPQNGDPLGYRNDSLSKDYAGILYSSNFEDLQYNGPANPTYFGSLLNTLSWKQLELSFNITWKAGYFFRRNSIHYYDFFYGTVSGHPDLLQRWKKPGDEQGANIPSLKFPPDSRRDDFYKFSGALIEKGDHIRFQDIRLSYSISKRAIRKLPVDLIRVYSYVNNIGLLWTANNKGIDPDFINTIKSPLSIALGVKVDF